VPVSSLVDAELFRSLLRRHAAAVVVITAPGEVIAVHHLRRAA
jgi:hypothetical protein